MTPDEIRIVEALAGCSFLPGSSQKRFIRHLNARDRAKPLTGRQAAYLWAIAWSWRRQLPPELVTLARAKSGGIGIRGRKAIEEYFEWLRQQNGRRSDLPLRRRKEGAESSQSNCPGAVHTEPSHLADAVMRAAPGQDSFALD